MNADTKAQIMALAAGCEDDMLLASPVEWLRRRDREAWATLTAYQREQYKIEARFLHRAHHLTPAAAVSQVRRMIRIGVFA